MLGQDPHPWPQVPARKRCVFDEPQVQIVLCRLSPNADVGQTSKHFPRTATAASRYAFEIAFGSTLVAVIIGGPRSVPTELIMNRSVTDDRAVPSQTVQHFAK
jgi:hypothetical protein